MTALRSEIRPMPTRRPTAPAMRALSVLALFGAVAMLPACSSGSPPPRGGTRLPEPKQIDFDAWASVGYRWEWTSSPPLTARGQVQFVDAFPDLLVVQDTGAMVSVLEAATGRVRWSKQVAETNTRFLGNTRRGTSVVVTNETELFEFDLQSGNTLDRTPVRGIATTRPVFFGPLAVLGTGEGRLVAIDVRYDIRAWEYQLDGLIETVPLRVDDEHVAGVSTRGEVRVIHVGDQRSQSAMRISGDSGEEMVTDGDYLYIASLDQSVYGYDVVDGHRLWRLRSSRPVTVQPTLLDGTLYATTADHGLTAIEGVTGEILWSNRAIGGWVLTTNGGDLMVWTGLELLRVDAARGDVISRTSLPGLSGLRADAPEQGNIYAIGANGSIAKFSPR